MKHQDVTVEFCHRRKTDSTKAKRNCRASNAFIIGQSVNFCRNFFENVDFRFSFDNLNLVIVSSNQTFKFDSRQTIISGFRNVIESLFFRRFKASFVRFFHFEKTDVCAVFCLITGKLLFFQVANCFMENK
jgi:hypothetical protein